MIQKIPDLKKLQERANLINCRANKRGLEERITKWDLFKLIGRSEGRCEWCNKQLGEHFAFDHIQPYRVYGRTNNSSNLAVSCKNCNSRKADKHPAAWAMLQYVKGIRTKLIERIMDEYDLDRLVQQCLFEDDGYIEELVLKRVS